MRHSLKFGVAAMLVAGWVSLGISRAAEEDKPKHTIKDVMKLAHKKDEGLKDKVIAGKATAEEKKELVVLYEDLGKNKPPKGGEESWKKLTAALVAAAKGVAADKEGSVDALKAAANCGACHKEHK